VRNKQGNIPNTFKMKKKILMVVLVALFSWQNKAASQNPSTIQSLDSINTILKANPFHDGFNDISFYYSVNITGDKELIVEMSFDGPFKWVYKAKISELDLTFKKDICKDSPGSICWLCKQTEPGKPNSCIQAEMIFTDGGSEKENSSNICVSFSSRPAICNDLNMRFQRLFSNLDKY
jgi:hypothetical protein